jgi:membrane protease YdiL (CAAX protease family)
MTTRRRTALVLVVLGVLWLLVDGPVEGAILFRLSQDHGVTLADLLSVALFVVAGWLWVTGGRKSAAGATREVGDC